MTIRTYLEAFNAQGESVPIPGLVGEAPGVEPRFGEYLIDFSLGIDHILGQMRLFSNTHRALRFLLQGSDYEIRERTELISQ